MSADEDRGCREWPTWASVWSQDSPGSQGFGATGWGGRPSVALSQKRANQGRTKAAGEREDGKCPGGSPWQTEGLQDCSQVMHAWLGAEGMAGHGASHSCVQSLLCCEPW